MSGWFKAPTADWPVIAEVLPKPWPLEAVRMDLAYLADRSKMIGDLIPGRPALAERWGWTERKTRTLLDQIKNKTLQQRPTSVQRASNERPATERFDDVFDMETSNERPTSVQRASSANGFAYINIYTETETDTDIKEKINKKEKEIFLPDRGPEPRDMQPPSQAPLSEKAGQSTALLEASPRNNPADSEKNGEERTPSSIRRAEPGGLTPLPPASRSNCSETRDNSVFDAEPYKDTMDKQNERNAQLDESIGYVRGGEVVPFRRLLQDTTGLNPRQFEGNRAFEVDDYALFVKHWLSRSPGAVPHVSSKPARSVRAAIRRHGLQACIDVIDWVHDSKHSAAVFLQEKDAVTFNALFKPEKEADYINLAAKWVADGKPEGRDPNRRYAPEGYDIASKFDTDPKWNRVIDVWEGPGT